MVRIFSCSGRCTKISLEFYGQSAIFDHFVRNRYFSSRPFTDKLPIFIDLSVNDNDFAKCSATHHLLNHCTWLRLRAKRRFLRFARNLRPHFSCEGNWVEYFFKFLRFCSTFRVARSGFGESGRQKRGIHPVFCLFLGPRAQFSKYPVDKKEAFIPVFVYFQDRAPQFSKCQVDKNETFSPFLSTVPRDSKRVTGKTSISKICP